MTFSTYGLIAGLLLAVLGLGSFSVSPSPRTLKFGGWCLIIGGLIFGASMSIYHFFGY